MLWTSHSFRRLTRCTALALAGLLFSATAAAAANDGSGNLVQQRSVFGQIGHYLANNSYGSLGALHFQYFGDSNNLQAHGTTATALVGSSSLAGSGTSISNETTVGATIGVFLPRTEHHLAIEFTLAPPIKFDFQAKGTAQDIGSTGLAHTVLGGPTGQKIGTFKALPPTFSVVFRPFTQTVIQPYFGVGAMWLHTYDQDVTNPRLAQAAATLQAPKARLDLSQPWACVAQAGFNAELPKPFFLKIGARYIGCATVHATLNLGTSRTLGDLGTVTTSNQFKAMLYQASFGANF